MLKRCIYLVFFLVAANVQALDLELTQGINATLPIGINALGNDPAAAVMAGVIRHDLEFSGQFRVISPPMGVINGVQGLPLWRHAGADSVLSGHVSALGANRYAVEVTLADPLQQGHVLLTKRFEVNAAEMRALAHHVSDLVYEKLLGERGIFSTRIAYVLVKRQGNRSRYSLEVADVDGYNPQSLLVSSEPLMSPSWSPDGRYIAYVSFEHRKPQIFTVEVSTGNRRLVTDFNGINGAPSWSPDGRTLAVVLSKTGSSKIYTVDLSNGAIKQVTFGSAIDTEPRFASDGRSLIFTSGRGGSPQIYRLTLADGTVTRLTFDGNYNARASLTPDQKHMVFFHREDSVFHIAVQDLDTGRLHSLTSAALDESPSVSPNGRLILYATRYQDKGVLGMVSVDGSILLRLPSRDGDVQEPAWSGFF